MSDEDLFNSREVAEFDQAMAASAAILQNLVASYAVRRKQDHAAGLPEQATILALTHTLNECWDEAQTLSALAAAVIVLAQTYA